MTTTLTIARLGHHGDGIAAGPVFVPLSLPGEEVEGTPDGDRLTDPRILRPSPHRVAAPRIRRGGRAGRLSREG